MTTDTMADMNGIRKRPSKKTIIAIILFVTLFAFTWACWQIHQVSISRTSPLDLDGWGHRVDELKQNESWTTLFRRPSLWKGPIVPFVFGLSYYVYASDQSVLIFSAICFACSAGLLMALSIDAQLPILYVVIGVLAWIVYPAHSFVHGYYYAESFVTVLSIIVMTSVYSVLQRPSMPLIILSGLLSGVLLLARAPYVFVIGFVFIIYFLKLRKCRVLGSLLFAFSVSAVLTPWVVRNYIEVAAFVPFTLEGGKILFQGTYIAGDDAVMNELRMDKSFKKMEEAEHGMSPIDQYRYWQKSAFQNMLSDPFGQLKLVVRKAIRFWAYLPKYGWIPAFFTGVSSLIVLFLAVVGVAKYKKNLLVVLCAIWIVGLWLFHSVVHSELRYNFPVLCFLFILAMLGIESLLVNGRKRGSSVTC